MAMTTPDRDKDDQLACGRSFETVWENAAQPADDHETTCPHCQDARTGLARLHEATRGLTDHNDDPELQVSPGLKASIMEVARTEVRRSRMLPLIQPRPDQLESALSISEHAIAAQIRAAADTLPGVHARRCTVDIDKSDTPGADLTTTGAGDQPARVMITLRVAVSARTQIPGTMRLLRTQIADHLAHRTGLEMTKINIAVEDIYDA